MRLWEVPDGLSFSIKWHRTLWSGAISGGWSLDAIAALLESAGRCLGYDCHFRLIHKGKQVPLDLTVGDLNLATSKVLHTVCSLQGGAASSTKLTNKTQQKNFVASILLQEGYDLKWVSATVDKVTEMVGAKELASLTDTAKGDDKLQAILRMLKDCRVEIPQIKPTKTSQTAHLAKRKKETTLPDPTQYSLVPGTLVNHDGSPTPQTMDFSCKATGYMTILPQQAAPWLQSNSTLSPDELVLLIFGPCPTSTTLETTSLTLPFNDQKGQQVLIACAMVQFGDRKVQHANLDPHRITQDQSIMMALTLWQTDWDSAAWELALQNPFKFVKALPGAEDSITSMWGKSLRRGNKPTTQRDATSIQMDCLVKENKVNTFLARTGFNLLWAMPKDENGRPNNKWKLIWLDEVRSIPEANLLASKVPDSCGLVKSGNKMALRLPANKFDDAWKIVNPSKQLPIAQDTSMLYKLESLPFGATSAMLEAWSTHIGWTFRPIRQLGARAWLIGTGTAPTQHLTFNGLHVLARALPPKTTQVSYPIVAGPRPTQSATSSALPPLNGDPWSNWSGSSSLPALSTVPSANRSVTGPTADKLAEHDSKLQSLEDALKTIQEIQKQQGTHIEKVHADAKASNQQLKDHVDQKIVGLREELDNSFASALAKQSESFERNLGDIKKLLLAQPKHKQPANSDAEMQEG